MTDLKCVVEGCDLEYDVVCSFSFYNLNIASDNEVVRQDWIDGAMQDESESLWRHVSLQLCGYHFELDSQGLWIDSPMLPEILTPSKPRVQQTEQDKKLVELILGDHSYCGSKPIKHEVDDSKVSRLNVRQLVDTLGYLSLKKLQRKQVWVATVESDKTEASIVQAEQVITKIADPKQIIEIVPQTSNSLNSNLVEDTLIPDNFIYGVAGEQEIAMDEVQEVPTSENQEWTVNIITNTPKPKYAYVKHCQATKKKRHFTAEMNEVSFAEDYNNYYILPDVDPSVGVEVTTSYEPETYIVEEYPQYVLNEVQTKNSPIKGVGKKRKKKIKVENDEWVIENSFEDEKGAARVRRKNKKYLGYDFVT